MRRTTLPAIAFLVVTLTGCGGGSTSGTAGHDSSASQDPGRTDAKNYALAAAESERVLRSVPVPPGADRLSGKPADWPQGGSGMSPSDTTLTRTAWYRVPDDADQVQAFLLSHDPAGLRHDPGALPGSSGQLRILDYSAVRSSNPAAYTGIDVIVQWTDIDGGTVLRFDTWIAARRARGAATMIQGTPSVIDLHRKTIRTSGPRRPAHVLPVLHLRQPRDGVVIARLTAILDALSGSPISNTMHGCPPMMNPTDFTLVVHDDDGSLQFHLLDLCTNEVEVRRNGHLVSPPLDPGDLRTVLSDLAPNRA
jgi:hypothetical protein